jgi:hypothetical protein
MIQPSHDSDRLQARQMRYGMGRKTLNRQTFTPLPEMTVAS